jgi:hypothetical protein
MIDVPVGPPTDAPTAGAPGPPGTVESGCSVVGAVEIDGAGGAMG